MTHQLSGLIVRRRETEANDNVIEAPLQLGEQVVAGDTLLACRLFEVAPELVFEDSVDSLHLLLLAQLKAVAHNLRFPVPAMLATDGLWTVLLHLSTEYSLFNGDDHSTLEWNEIEESWEQFGRSDVARALRDVGRDDVADAVADMSTEQFFDVVDLSGQAVYHSGYSVEYEYEDIADQLVEWFDRDDSE